MRRRSGQVGTGLIVTLSAIGTLAAVAVVAGPRLVSAGGDDGSPASVVASDPAHQQAFDALADLIGRSHAVLAVHGPAGARPFTEVLLWIEDGGNRGTVDAEELGLLTHSAVLQTVSFAAIEPEPEPALPDPLRRGPPPRPALDDETLRSPSFGAAWRAVPDVRSRVLARGLSDMSVTREEGLDRLRISLTWPGKTADRPDKASAVVDARGRAPNGQE